MRLKHRYFPDARDPSHPIFDPCASIRDKGQFLIPFIETLSNPEFKTGTLEADQTLLKSIIVFACLMEGLLFYLGFTQILALGRQNKMMGAAEQYQYILRANCRAVQIGLEPLFPNDENPFPWMSEMIDLKKERSFFETRVTEYQTGGALNWE